MPTVSRPEREPIAIFNSLSREYVHKAHLEIFHIRAFTLVELLASIAIIAVLTVGAVIYIGNYVTHTRQTADKQTLIVLNDALTRYKTEGGDISALTQGAPMGRIISKMASTITWGGLTHQVLKVGTTYPSDSLSGLGDGKYYRFIKYNTYTDTGIDTANLMASTISSTLGAKGYSTGNTTEFNNWLKTAIADTGSTNYLALTNPLTTDRFGIYVKVASAGKKVRVWWGDGTTNNYDNISTSSTSVISKIYSSAAARGIVIVGDLAHIYSSNDAGLGGVGSTAFGGNINTINGIAYLNIAGTNTVSGDISNLAELTYLNILGQNTLSGSVTKLTKLTTLQLGGSNTVTGDVSAITNLQWFSLSGSNTCTGDISGMSGILFLSLQGNNTCMGDVSNLTNMHTMVLSGNNSCSGSIGNLANLRVAQAFGNSNCTGFDLAATNSPSLRILQHNRGDPMTPTQVNTALAGMYANRNASKPLPYVGFPNTFAISFTAIGDAPPTGQGLTDKTNLITDGWSVTTN